MAVIEEVSLFNDLPKSSTWSIVVPHGEGTIRIYIVKMDLEGHDYYVDEFSCWYCSKETYGKLKSNRGNSNLISSLFGKTIKFM